jgi:hypothetical protein
MSLPTYMDCPKCDSEFEFDFDLAVGRWIETRGVIRHCSCEFTEAELDEIEKQAAEKFEP